MAIIRSLAIGKARKSAGNLTFATIQGRTIAREKPAFVKNPKTPKQLEQRSKMSKTVAAYRAFGGMVKQYFTTLPKYTSQYNEFVSRNISIADQFVVDEETGNVSNIVGATVARGSIQLVHQYPLENNQSGIMEGYLMTTPGFTAVEGDQLIYLGFDSVENKLISLVENLEQGYLDNFNDGKSYSFDVTLGPNELTCVAVVYYSPSRNMSSTAQLVEPVRS